MSRKLRSPQQSIPGLWLGIIQGRRKGFGANLIRSLLFGLSELYRAGLAVYLFAEKAGVRRRERLPVPVISIGNVTSGGTGKTPITELLVRKLALEDLKPAILSRGHGGTVTKGVAQVSDSKGKILIGPDVSGDESSLLARLLPGVPVFVGRDRRESGKTAIERESPGVIVLDDGMQYWQLARNLDIALVDATDPFDNGYLLPRGHLREPKSNLKRAGVIVITRADSIAEARLGALQAEIRQISRASDIFLSRHAFGGLRPLNDLAESTLPSAPLGVCAIAQPKQFFDMLARAGIGIRPDRQFPLDDHDPIAPNTLSHIVKRAKSVHADSIVMTEKDAVKVDCKSIDLPCYAVKLAIEMDDLNGFYSAVFRRAGLTCKPRDDCQQEQVA